MTNAAAAASTLRLDLGQASEEARAQARMAHSPELSRFWGQRAAHFAAIALDRFGTVAAARAAFGWGPLTD